MLMRRVVAAQGQALVGLPTLVGLILAISVRPVPVLAQQTPSAIEQLILSLEEQWTHARRMGDVAKLERLLAEDYTAVSANGELRSRADLLAVYREPSDLHNDQVRVRVYGDAAMVTGRTITTVQQSGRSGVVHAYFIRVWARRGLEWKNVLFQGTYIIARQP